MNATTQFTLEQLRQLYDDVELAILYDWLGWPRPAALRSVDAYTPPENVDEDFGWEDDRPEPGPVRIIRNKDALAGVDVSNAVARLLLSEIQDRLPQWAAFHNNGHVDWVRKRSPTRKAKAEPLPRFLFDINWADSGPGFSWPEAYYCTHLPGFDRYVVSASQDSPDVHGYTDEAIGHFGLTEELHEACRQIIIGWWREIQPTDGPEYGWQNLFGTGEIGVEEAYAWRNSVWGAEETDDETHPDAVDDTDDLGLDKVNLEGVLEALASNAGHDIVFPGGVQWLATRRKALLTRYHDLTGDWSLPVDATQKELKQWLRRLSSNAGNVVRYPAA